MNIDLVIKAVNSVRTRKTRNFDLFKEIFTCLIYGVALGFIPRCIALVYINTGLYRHRVISTARSLVSFHLYLGLHRRTHVRDSVLRGIATVLFHLQDVSIRLRNHSLRNVSCRLISKCGALADT